MKIFLIVVGIILVLLIIVFIYCALVLAGRSDKKY